MEDVQQSNEDNFDFLSLLDDTDLPCIQQLALPDGDLLYFEETTYADLEASSENTQQSNEDDVLPSELFHKLFVKHPQAFKQLLVDEDSQDGSDGRIQVGNDFGKFDMRRHPLSNHERLLGWTPKDNENLFRIMDGVMNKCKQDGRKVSWQEITNLFNAAQNQSRTKIQLYSHVRYSMGVNRRPCYMKAEEEVILALDEIAIPPTYMVPFLVNERSANLLAAKLQRLKASSRVQVQEGRQAAFRKRVQEIVLKNGGLDALKDGTMPSSAFQHIRHLASTNPNLRKRYLALKPAGRPSKKTKIVPVTLQLKMLFKPFVYINKRRRRITGLPGDGRKYGLSMFCLNRLLGSPLEVSMMPDNEEDAINAGVDTADYRPFAVLRELMLLHEQKEKTFKSVYLPPKLLEISDLNPESAQEDRKRYHSNPEHPPNVSILPPTLYSLTGLRGLLCYQDTLKSIAEEDGDENQNLSADLDIGDEEANRKLGHFLLSVFQTALDLSEINGDPVANSDGESDSDEDICFSEERPERNQMSIAKTEVTKEESSAADASFDELLNSGTTQHISPEMEDQFMEAFQLLVNDRSINLDAIEGSLSNGGS